MSNNRIKTRRTPAWKASIQALLWACIAASGAGIADSSDALLGLPQIAIPEDNPLTPEKIALGKKLFFDRRLSKNGTLSCAMCHIPEQAFAQNELATSVGFEGKSLRRNAPSLLNVALQDSFQRDGAKASLETQVWGPLLAADEMANGDVEGVVERIKTLPDYPELFEQAFPGDGAGESTIGKALAAFERTLLAGNSRFDRWYFGAVDDALTTQEKAGFRFFVDAGCGSCHRVADRDALFSDGQFHNTGVADYVQQSLRAPVEVQLAPGVTIRINRESLATVSDVAMPDLGRFAVTGIERDRYAYKTPTLRNVALTYPYMHDGSFASLEQVIEWYSHRMQIISGSLTPLPTWTREEKDSLRAFLQALTSDPLPVANRQ